MNKRKINDPQYIFPKKSKTSENLSESDHQAKKSDGKSVNALAKPTESCSAVTLELLMQSSPAPHWRLIKEPNLNLRYAVVYPRHIAARLFSQLEQQVKFGLISLQVMWIFM